MQWSLNTFLYDYVILFHIYEYVILFHIYEYVKTVVHDKTVIQIQEQVLA